MDDTLLNDLYIIQMGDTNNVSLVDTVDFLQIESVDINPILHFATTNYDIITYILFFLLGVFSIIWYFLPERLSAILSLKLVSKLQRVGDGETKVLGSVVSGFFWINFIVSAGFFILLVLQIYYANEIINISFWSLMTYIYLILLVLLLYRIFIIWGIALIFQTNSLMKKQVEISRNILFLTGVLLIPIILVILYISGDSFIYFGIATIGILQAYRIIQVAIIGKSSTIFSTLHIILYLCALEIVPVLVLVRLIHNGAII